MGPNAAAGLDPERRRLTADRDGGERWRRWGPYLAERQWATVREDYSATGDAWGAFPHGHARSRAYRWGEDGLLGLSDDQARLCFAVALWNGNDPILKERLFGLTGAEGNHGEDVKEAYHYLDATPTHSYLKALYRYPHRAFPYADLVAVNGSRGRDEPEYELVDTGIFDGDRYFDVTVEYAKAAPDDILVRVTAVNRGPDAHPLHLLPTLWFRNEWAWGPRGDRQTPVLRAVGPAHVEATHDRLGAYRMSCSGEAELLFTSNETNAERLWGGINRTPYVKDAFHDAVVDGRMDRVDPTRAGTKVAAHYVLAVPAAGSATILLRLSGPSVAVEQLQDPFAEASQLFVTRIAEADEFHARLTEGLDDEARSIHRQACAGLIWTRQSYHYDVGRWLDGDPTGPPPPAERQHGRNAGWRHLNNADVISMPDSWEYPWYASWDLAFHCVAFARLDPEFAKRQLVLLLREWYMHPNGQVPAYEWAFDDVNPPVLAWAALRVYEVDAQQSGTPDRDFLERVFHKLVMNFTWWVNRKDHTGRNVFQGGFLGLDNIGVFDRSKALPTGGYLEQADGTAWMGMFALQLTAIALELARGNRVYEDVATKYFEHFLYIAGAMNDIGGEGIQLWDDEDGFFYDVLRLPDGGMVRLRVRSLVGLVPLLAVDTIEPEVLRELPGFARRLDWFLANRPELAALVSRWAQPGAEDRRLLALVRPDRMRRLLARMLDPEEFLSPYGIRSMSRAHADAPFDLSVGGERYTVAYEPAESRSGLFGGNSNWRGPIWFPIDYLLIEALREFHGYYGDSFLVEHPTGSGVQLPLDRVADDLAARLVAIFRRGADGRRPLFGDDERSQTHPSWRDDLLFHEYFHGDTGAGLGASHQTGWTALVAPLMQR